MARLDDTWIDCQANLPRDLRLTALALPWRLGLTRHPEQGWEAFWTLDPNRRPASYGVVGAEAPPTQRSGGAEPFDRAHHYAVFYGLLFDRVADRQVDSTGELVELRDVLLAGWVESLTRALGDAGTARAVVDSAVAELVEGTRVEDTSLRTRRLTTDVYASQTRSKLRWCSASGRAYVEAREGGPALDAYRQTFDLFGMAVQCMDDAVDAEEDERLHGVSIPSLLGVADESLLEAARTLIVEAERTSSASGFVALAAWLARFGRFLSRAGPAEGDRVRRLREGKALGEALVGAM